MNVDSLYTFVLSEENDCENKFVNINGINVITWGHGLTTDKVVSHDFFSSRERIVEALRKIDEDGFEKEGEVTVEGFARDPKTRRIVGLF